IKKSQKRSISEFFEKKKKAGNVKIAKEIIKIFVETERDENAVAGIKSGIVHTNVENDESEKPENTISEWFSNILPLAKKPEPKKQRQMVKMDSSKKRESRRIQDKKAKNIEDLFDKASPQKSEAKESEECDDGICSVQSPEQSIKKVVDKQSEQKFEIIYPRGLTYSRINKFILHPQYPGKRRALIISDSRVIFSTEFNSVGNHLPYHLKSGKYRIVICQMIEKKQFENSVSFTVPTRKNKRSIRKELRKIKKQIADNEDPTVHLMNGILLSRNNYYIDAILEYSKYLRSQENSRFGKIQLLKAVKKAGLDSFNENNIDELIAPEK
ncbi:hypothetical protein KAJ27_10580, partial [bacterium]|nr:hypothetical protein [bacterium]